MKDEIVDVEHQLIPVLVKMELEGVKIDIKILSSVELELDELLKLTKNQIHQFTDIEINLNSAEQVSELLFDTLRIEPKTKKKSNSKSFSVDKSL